MADTTALGDGDIDAVAASLIEGPEVDDESDDDVFAAGTDTDAAQNAPEDTEADAEDEGDAGDDADDAGDDDNDDTEDADDDDTAEPLYTVKVNGREQQVPLSELLRGYSGQTAIQQGFREVASARKEVESVYTALQTERQQIAALAQQLQGDPTSLQPPVPPDDNLIERDPIEYMVQRQRYERAHAQYVQTQQALQEQAARNAQQAQQAQQAYLRAQQEQLVRALPGFAKPETAAKLRSELLRTGVEVYGYAPEELRQVMDHRALLILHDAAQYRKLVSGRARAEKQAEMPRTPVIRPGTKASATVGKKATAEKARSAMKKTGSVDDVARFLLS